MFPERRSGLSAEDGSAGAARAVMLEGVNAALRQEAELIRSRLLRAEPSPAVFRRALMSVPAIDRDAWVDLVFGLETPPEDGPELPRGCVPYLPCPVDALLRMIDIAKVEASDVFVDVGSGVGRAAALVHLLTGAATIGLEIQPALVQASRALSESLKVTRFSPVEGDASRLTGLITIGTVFFLYCPFSGNRLERVVDDLDSIARTRKIRICCVDVPLRPRPWLTPISAPAGDLTVYASRWAARADSPDECQSA
jgi:hypothetical protein